MIDERKLIEELNKNSIFKKVTVGEETVYDVIDRLPKVCEWIPCSERLPEEFGWYLTTCKGEQTVQMKFYDEIWASVTKVIAWMPLPAPYKGEEQ